MRQGSGRPRGTPRKRSTRGERLQRSGTPDEGRDIGPEIEEELEASGRTNHVPREGLIGAHERKRAPASENSNPDERLDEPTGRGADVAPTRKAELREAQRHQLERQLGHAPAGIGKTLRHPITLQARAWSWINRHRTELAFGVGGVVLAAGCLGAASLLRRPR